MPGDAADVTVKQTSRKLYHLHLAGVGGARPSALPIHAVFTDSSLEERFKLDDICQALTKYLPKSLGGGGPEPKLKTGGSGKRGMQSHQQQLVAGPLPAFPPGELEKILLATFPPLNDRRRYLQQQCYMLAIWGVD